MINKKIFNIQNLFLICAIFWGSLFILINPPFQAPDEDAHFFKMYGYTQGSFNFKKLNNYTGQTLPESFIQLQKFYDALKFDNKIKTSPQELKQAKKIILNKDKTEFFKFIPTSYTPISYFPSCLVMFFIKFLNITPINMIFILRFCSLFTYLALCYAAIKITPIHKLLFFAIFLLPLNLYQAGAVSTDGLTLGLVFLFITYTLKLKFSDDNLITKKENIIWTSLITLITICKYAYLPLILLYFLIPSKKFENKKIYFKNFILILLLNVFITLFFVYHVISISQNCKTELTETTIDKKLLIQHILIHPIEYLKMIVLSIVKLHRFYINNLITSFGWNSTMVPIFITNLFYAILFLCAFFKEETEKLFSYDLKERSILIFSGLMIFFIVITSVYLIYQKSPIITGVQGRYLFPLLPMFFIMFFNKKYYLKNRIIPVFVISFMQILLFISLLTLISRFY